MPMTTIDKKQHVVLRSSACCCKAFCMLHRGLVCAAEHRQSYCGLQSTDTRVVCCRAQTTLLCAAEHRQYFPREHSVRACQWLLCGSDLLGHFPGQVQPRRRSCCCNGNPHDCHVLLWHVIGHIQLQVQAPLPRPLYPPPSFYPCFPDVVATRHRMITLCDMSSVVSNYRHNAQLVSTR